MRPPQRPTHSLSLSLIYLYTHTHQLWINDITDEYSDSTYLSLQLQTPSETVFGLDFWGLNTFSGGIWSTLSLQFFFFFVTVHGIAPLNMLFRGYSCIHLIPQWYRGWLRNPNHQLIDGLSDGNPIIYSYIHSDIIEWL